MCKLVLFVESAEYHLLFGLRDTDSGVLYIDLHFFGLRHVAPSQFDGAFPGKFGGIVQEVGDHLNQPVFVDVYDQALFAFFQQEVELSGNQNLMCLISIPDKGIQRIVITVE